MFETNAVYVTKDFEEPGSPVILDDYEFAGQTVLITYLLRPQTCFDILNINRFINPGIESLVI